MDGRLDRTLRGDHIVEEFTAILDDYVERRYPSGVPATVSASENAQQE